jgi:hypothetical protein
MKTQTNNWRVPAKHPDFDAVVIIERRAGLVLLDFPAQGNSQRRAGGKVVGYTRRNPDRRALVKHMLATLEADFADACPVGAKGGKGGNWGSDTSVDVLLAEPTSLTTEMGFDTMAALHSKSRNYRFSMWLRWRGVDCGESVPCTRSETALEAFGLVPTTHKSTNIWPEGLGVQS